MRMSDSFLRVAAVVLLTAGCGVVFVGCQHEGMSASAKLGDPPSDPPPDPPSAEAGAKVFATQGCIACHTVNGKGGKVGPNLSNEANKGRSKQWLAEQLRAPKSHNASSIMPSFKSLADTQINDLVAYLMSLSTDKQAKAVATAPAVAGAKPQEHPAVAAARDIKTGAEMWSQNCNRCHNYRAPDEYSDSQWAVVVAHMRLRAPLTGQQQKLILAFLQSSN